MVKHSGGPANASSTDRPRQLASWRRIWRRVIVPVLAIVVIASVIWWLESRQGPGTSPSGEEYGPRDLPVALVPPAMEVGLHEGKLAPNFLLETLDGGEMRLSDLRGQAVVINFWATWCKPCRKEIPELVDAYNSYRDRGLIILGVNMQEGKGIVRPFAEEFGMKFPIPIDRDGEVGDSYRILGLPTTYFVDRGGVVRSVFTGPFVEQGQGTNVQGAIEENELLKRIEQILK